MYEKTYNLHNSPALALAEALLVSSSPVFDGLHDDTYIKNYSSVFLPEVIKEKATAENKFTKSFAYQLSITTSQ